MININGFLKQKQSQNGQSPYGQRPKAQMVEKPERPETNKALMSSDGVHMSRGLKGNVDVGAYIQYIKNNVKNKNDVSHYELLNNRFKQHNNKD